MSEIRRFPLPWKVEGNESCFWVEDAEGKRFGYTYFESGHVSIGSGTGLKLTRDEARRIARGIARLPELLKRLQ